MLERNVKINVGDNEYEAILMVVQEEKYPYVYNITILKPEINFAFYKSSESSYPLFLGYKDWSRLEKDVLYKLESIVPIKKR